MSVCVICSCETKSLLCNQIYLIIILYIIVVVVTLLYKLWLKDFNFVDKLTMHIYTIPPTFIVFGAICPKVGVSGLKHAHGNIIAKDKRKREREDSSSLFLKRYARR